MSVRLLYRFIIVHVMMVSAVAFFQKTCGVCRSFLHHSGIRGREVPVPSASLRKMFDILQQEVEDPAKEAMACGEPSGSAIMTRISEIMDTVSAQDVGIRETDFTRSKVCHYIPIASTPQFTIGVFVIPANLKLPIHDHPGMAVYSKLLFGTLRLRSFDVLPEQETKMGSAIQGRRKAACVESIISAPAQTWSLTPQLHNLHELHAVSTCAILDVLLPPYNHEHTGGCSYYTVREIDDNSGTCILDEIPEPRDLPVYRSDVIQSFTGHE